MKRQNTEFARMTALLFRKQKQVKCVGIVLFITDYRLKLSAYAEVFLTRLKPDWSQHWLFLLKGWACGELKVSYRCISSHWFAFLSSSFFHWLTLINISVCRRPPWPLISTTTHMGKSSILFHGSFTTICGKSVAAQMAGRWETVNNQEAWTWPGVLLFCLSFS